ncbi:MAG TPA: hypothetical protein PK022_07790 [Syntrophales bacterium]|nr:hypothetical protein [Syntrophales bacterium]
MNTEEKRALIEMDCEVVPAAGLLNGMKQRKSSSRRDVLNLSFMTATSTGLSTAAEIDSVYALNIYDYDAFSHARKS